MGASALWALSVWSMSPSHHPFIQVMPVKRLHHSLLLASAGLPVLLGGFAAALAIVATIGWLAGAPTFGWSSALVAKAVASLVLVYLTVSSVACWSIRSGFWVVVGAGVYAVLATIDWQGMRNSEGSWITDAILRIALSAASVGDLSTLLRDTEVSSWGWLGGSMSWLLTALLLLTFTAARHGE